MLQTHKSEIEKHQRFKFGSNWKNFLDLLNESRILQAEKSLCLNFGVEDLTNKRFLDAGSGSGLFSLAARRLGATVYSFDYDPQSVACTRVLQNRYFPNDPLWIVEEGSVLDKNYLSKLGRFDIVYSWGVLHHTGAMWEALDNVTALVDNDGKLFISIYNSQGWISQYWSLVKMCYVNNILLRQIVLLIHAPYLFGFRYILRRMTGRLDLERGMSLWYDMIDWIGGYPFEYAKPEQIFSFFHTKMFTLERLKTCGGRLGCNEFVFSKN